VKEALIPKLSIFFFRAVQDTTEKMSPCFSQARCMR